MLPPLLRPEPGFPQARLRTLPCSLVNEANRVSAACRDRCRESAFAFRLILLPSLRSRVQIAFRAAAAISGLATDSALPLKSRSANRRVGPPRDKRNRTNQGRRLHCRSLPAVAPRDTHAR